MKKTVFLTAAAIFCCGILNAIVPHRMSIPDIPGYQTLLGDFHVHTTFSDAKPWPSTRIDEAYYDGLDVIAITDHCDSRHRHMVKSGYFNDEKCDRNASFELARNAARKYDIIVLHGCEVTRGKRLFAGHFNTHFISDGNAVAAATEKDDAAIKDVEKREQTGILNGLREARRQGAFITYNHPNWAAQEPNEPKWLPIHEQLYKEGLMNGIEIENHSVGYCPEAFHWAMERNLTIVSGTDCHVPMSQLVDYETGEYRSMTLIFAKERTEAGVREALDNHRTAVYNDGYFYGREDLLRPLFDKALEIRETTVTGKSVKMSVRNVTSVPIYLSKAPGSENLSYRRELKLSPGEEAEISISPAHGGKSFGTDSIDVNYYVKNYHTDADTPLKVSYHFEISK